MYCTYILIIFPIYYIIYSTEHTHSSATNYHGCKITKNYWKLVHNSITRRVQTDVRLPDSDLDLELDLTPRSFECLFTRNNTNKSPKEQA